MKTELTYRMKEADYQILRDAGVIQEVNRVFFHPLGLVLSVSVDKKTGQAFASGEIFETDDPEGYAFEPLDGEKLKAFQKWKATRTPERLAALGYTIEGGE